MTRLVVASLVTLAALACGGRPATAPLPSSPTEAVDRFLAAVRANDLQTMVQLFGSERGPAQRWMEPTELTQRLTVIRSFLVHERYAIEPGNTPLSTPNRPILQVRLTRRGCQPVVPFTLARYRSGWLVFSADIGEAGHPLRRCQ